MTEYLTTIEAAESIGRTRQWVIQAVNQGRIEGAIKHGRDWLIPKGFTITPVPRGAASHKRSRDTFPLA